MIPLVPPSSGRMGSGHGGDGMGALVESGVGVRNGFRIGLPGLIGAALGPVGRCRSEQVKFNHGLNLRHSDRHLSSLCRFRALLFRSSGVCRFRALLFRSSGVCRFQAPDRLPSPPTIPHRFCCRACRPKAAAGVRARQHAQRALLGCSNTLHIKLNFKNN